MSATVHHLPPRPDLREQESDQPVTAPPPARVARVALTARTVAIVRAARKASGPAARGTVAHAGLSVAGTWRAAGGAWRWVVADELRPNLQSKSSEVLKERQRRRTVARWSALAAVVGIEQAAVRWPEALTAAVIVAFVVAGVVERRIRASYATHAAGRMPAGKRPGQKVIRNAFASAKLGRAEDIRVIGPITRDADDKAWTALVELPAGGIARNAIARRSEIASALGVDSVQLDISPVPGHDGRVRIRCCDRDPFAQVVRSPLRSRRTALDVWADGIPLGVNARHEPISPRIVDSSFLIGGQPRTGKSVGVTSLVVAVILDPRPRVHIIDGKGAADFDPFAPLCHTFFKRQPDRLLQFLDDMVEAMEKRYDRLSQLGRKKIDAALLDEMPLEFVVIDELRWYTTHADLGKRIVGQLADLASRGPAAGILLVLATQRTTVDVVPGTLRASVSMRWAMRCDDPKSSNAILGDGRAGRGYDASQISREHRGVGWLDADGAVPVVMRSYLLEDDEVERLIEVARGLREAAGNLPEGDNRPGVVLLREVLGAIGDHDKVATAELLDRLGGEWTAETLADALRPLGVRPADLWIGGTSLRGYRRQDVQRALDRA